MPQSMFPVGTQIIATKNIGQAREGVLGIITGHAEIPFFFWKRQVYLCTFAGNYRVATKPSEVDDFDHGYTLTELENPAFQPDMEAVLQRIEEKWRRGS